MRTRTYLGLALLLAAAGLRGEPVTSDTIRIMLAEDESAVELRPDAPGVLTDLESGARHELAKGQTYIVRVVDGSGLKFGAWNMSAQLRYAPKGAEGLAALNGRRYRGTFLFERKDGPGMKVVNELGVEEYLYSVLSREMSPEWPMDALKAQAIISRTYALKNLGRYDDEGYDLLDDERSQVYGGVDSEAPRAISAVDATAGEVLVYRGRLVEAHFHSCCGGHTAAVEAAWHGSMRTRPLQGVRDSFCYGTPHYKWSQLVPASTVLKIFPEHEPRPRLLKSVAIGRRDRSGFVRSLKFATDEGTIRLAAVELRKKLGPEVMRSTNLTKVSVKKGSVLFAGRGWGHGVGLCQWGARVQAQRGRKYKNILKFYYPGTKVAKWKN